MRIRKRIGSRGTIAALIVGSLLGLEGHTQTEGPGELTSADLQLSAVAVRYMKDLDLLVFEQRVKGIAGKTTPQPAGQPEGAPVFAHVFRTSLQPQDIGFGPTAGLVALAVTSHPDFDDTPLWDENTDGKQDNDGVVYHSHWVVLVEDPRTPAGLAVKEFAANGASITVPATHPGMPLYLDSPGHSVVLEGDTLRVLVPARRVNNKTSFTYDGVTAFLRHSQASGQPMLGVHTVMSTAAKGEALGYKVLR